MERNALVRFTVTVISSENATWQGIVETDKEKFEFRSELQLLRWVMEQYPVLHPDASCGAAETR